MVEHNLAKVGVASSSLVFRSLIEQNDSTKSPGGGMVDAPVSGTGVSNDVQVRVLSWALMFKMASKCWRGGGIGRRATLRG